MATHKIFCLLMFLVLLMATPQYGYAQQKKKCNDFPRLLQDATNFIQKEDYRHALEKLAAAKACDPLQASLCNELILSVFDRIEAQRKAAETARLAALRAREQAKVAEKKATDQTVMAVKERNDANLQRQLAQQAQADALREKAYALEQKRIADSLKLVAERQTEIARIEGEKAKASALATKALQILAQNNTLSLRLAEEADKIASTEDTQEALMDITNNIRNLFYNASLEGHLGGIYAVASDPIGEFILTGSSDFTAKMWKPDGTFVRSFIGHSATVNAVAFSPKGDFILTGSNDNTVKIWTIDGKTVKTIRCESAVNSLAVSDDNNTFVIGFADNSASIRHIKDAVDIPFKPKTDDTDMKKKVVSITAVAFTGDTILTASTDYSVQIWSKEGSLLGKLQHTSPVTAMAALGGNVVTATGDRYLRLWQIGRINLDSEIKPSEPYIGHQSAIYSVALAYSGKSKEIVIASGGSDNTCILWGKNRRIDRIMQGHTLGVHAVSIYKDFVVTGSADRTAKIWQIAGSQPNSLDTFKSIQTAAITPDGNWVLVGGKAKILKMVSLTSETEKAKYFTLGQTVVAYASAFSPQGDKMLIAEGGNLARLRDANTGDVLATFKGHSSTVNAVAFSPKGEFILTGSWDHSAKLWDTTGREIRAFIGHSGIVYAVAFSPDGQTMATSSADNTLRLWDVKTGQSLRTFTGHAGRVYSVVFSPDGKKLISGSEDRTIRFWDINSGATLRTFAGHSLPINVVAVSPDGKTIASGSADKTIRVWSEDGYIAMLSGHRGVVNTLNFTPDGKYIVSGSADSTIRRWSWSPMGKLTPLQKMQYKLEAPTAALFETKQTDLLETFAQTLIKQLDKKTALDTSMVALVCRLYDSVATQIGVNNTLSYNNFLMRLENVKQGLTKPALREILRPFSERMKGYEQPATYSAITSTTASDAPSKLNNSLKKRIISIVNVFETGVAEPPYDNISVFADGRDNTRQITYGRTSSTEQGDLKILINNYIENRGMYANEFMPYLTKIGAQSLADDRAFSDLLKQSAMEDPIMIATQDQYFDRRFYQPAFRFFTDNGFTQPLSMLVIYDSYIHSGRVPDNIRARFKTAVPVNGGDEKEWVKDYLKARTEWLISKGEPLSKTSYRPAFMMKELEKGNWSLELPLQVTGVVIKE